jgi:hypothetical protein
LLLQLLALRLRGAHQLLHKFKALLQFRLVLLEAPHALLAAAMLVVIAVFSRMGRLLYGLLENVCLYRIFFGTLAAAPR